MYKNNEHMQARRVDQKKTPFRTFANIMQKNAPKTHLDFEIVEDNIFIKIKILFN